MFLNTLTVPVNYVAIGTDSSIDQEAQLFEHTERKPSLTTTFLSGNVYDDYDALCNKLSALTFDIVIIDIEPHWRELKVTALFDRYFSDTALVIYSCIGHMGTGGCGGGDVILSNEQFYSHVSSYLFIDSWQFRDIYVVYEKEVVNNDMCKDIISLPKSTHQWNDKLLKNHSTDPKCIPILFCGDCSDKNECAKCKAMWW
jgi:hypothetical protein